MGGLTRSAVEFALMQMQEENILKHNKNAEYKCPDLLKEDFWKLFVSNASGVLRKRGLYKEFIVDDYNREILKQLYLYLTGNKACKLNVNAGIILAGPVGCGKSVIMESFVNTYNRLCKRAIISIHTKDLVAQIKKEGVSSKNRYQPLYIDDMGRESDEIKDFGNVLTPMIDLFAARYDSGSRTFATTNFNYEELEKKYGEFIVSRLKEMCNFVVMIGPSKRVENPIQTYGKKI
ncbi:MAG: hypothetical protein LIR40_04720 [Bacteroidota bacterium]|nr:hypothetical protein [Bacteroidota bacterium]